MRLKQLPAALLLLLALFTLTATACGGPEAQGNPSLPAGFEQDPLPDVNLNGYVYLKPPAPIALPLSRLLRGKAVPPQWPQEVKVTRWTVYVGPQPDLFGMMFEVESRLDAARITSLLEQDTESQFRYTVKDNKVFLTHGEGEWVESLEASIREDRYTTLKARYPKVWDVVQLLPESPPNPPLAAGFGILDEGFISAMDQQYGNLTQDVGKFVQSARLDKAAFALYAEHTPTRLGDFDQSFLEDMGLTSLVTTKAGFPGFLVGFFFRSAISQAGFQQVDLGGTNAYYTLVGDRFHVVLRNAGNTFFVALSPERERAEALLRSTTP